jgi:hypothetical protein
MWYYAGEMDSSFRAGSSCEPLSDFWAKTIAYLATARLTRPPCACPDVRARFEDLQIDFTKNEGNVSYFVGDEILNNPLGTRKGEVKAWRNVKHLHGKKIGATVI